MRTITGLIFLLILIIACTACDKNEAMFPDPAFAKCVKDRIDYAVGIGLWQKDDPENYNKVTMLECYGGGVKSIQGIEKMPNMDDLSIVDNQVESLEPLRTLTKITFLKLDNNKIQDLTPLSELANLSSLSLSKNYIKDLTPLYALTKLGNVYLDRNCITDAQQFEELKKHSPNVITGDAVNYQEPDKCK